MKSKTYSDRPDNYRGPTILFNRYTEI